MKDESNGTNQATEQWAAFQQVWGETFSKMIQLGFTFSPESAPPEFMRQMRSGIFQALGQSWEQFLRSPQFMEGMKQYMDNAIAFRKMSNDFFSKARHETQGVSRDDIDAVILAVRHMETRVLDRMEELEARIDQTGKGSVAPKRSATPPARPKRTPKPQSTKTPRKK